MACRRQPHGALRTVTYRDGTTAYVHHTGASLGATVPPLAHTARSTATRAPDADLNRVYTALLAQPGLALATHHRDQLAGRGLTEADIRRYGQRSLPDMARGSVVRPLRALYRDELLLAVPGIVTRDGPYGPYLTLSGVPGLLVPVRSVAGLIVGLLLRPDHPRPGGKYLWLSQGGPGSGARVHVPPGARSGGRVIVTEGALKADVAAALSGRTLVGLPGPHVGVEALDTLRALQPADVFLALDADSETNYHVARAQSDGLAKLQAAGFAAGLLRWDARLGKGLDDALLSWRQGGHS